MLWREATAQTGDSAGGCTSIDRGPHRHMRTGSASTTTEARTLCVPGLLDRALGWLVRPGR